jgi:hypothetical protein
MPSSCVSTEEVTEIIYLPEMKHEDFIRKFQEGTKGVLEN